MYVAAAMKNMGNRDYQLWDEQDGFFYDVLRYPDGRYHKFRVRSLVGLIPLFAVERLEEKWIEPFKEFRANFDWFMKNRREHVRRVVHTVERDGEVTHVLTILNQDQLRRMTERLWDPNEFLSDYGIRSLSKAHEASPFEFDGSVRRLRAGRVGRHRSRGATRTGAGRSGSRRLPADRIAPQARHGVRHDARREPGARGPSPPLQMARDLADRLIRIFTRDEPAGRPVFGGAPSSRTTRTGAT